MIKRVYLTPPQTSSTVIISPHAHHEHVLTVPFLERLYNYTLRLRQATFLMYQVNSVSCDGHTMVGLMAVLNGLLKLQKSLVQYR